MHMRIHRLIVFRIAALALMGSLCVWHAFSAVQEDAKSSAVEEELTRARAAFERNAYSEAAAIYLKAAAQAESPPDKSRAYLGLALCAFSLRQMSTAELWVEEVFKVDPNKEISALFYPAAFVQMFREIRDRTLSVEAPETPFPQPVATPSDQPSESGVPTHRLLDPARGWLYRSDLRDKLEIEVHVSSWSLNPILNIFADRLSDEAGKAVRDELRSEVQRERPDMRPAYHEHHIKVASSGSNTGVGFRIYPRGRSGPFSLGVSLEKTVMRATVGGAVTQVFANGSRAVVDAEAYVELRPWSTNINFRWDVIPTRRVTPYFVLGLGLASLNGIVGYSYTGTYIWDGPDESLHDSDEMDFKTAGEEIQDRIPNILIILQTCLGLRAEIIGGLSLRAEAGFWDGIIFRGGLSYRF